jgi:NAD(P)-dependent dehydrogenase (short-subunit alcohol dehydrogenase family)
MSAKQPLEGRVALITGATAGIARAGAAAFASARPPAHSDHLHYFASYALDADLERATR